VLDQKYLVIFNKTLLQAMLCGVLITCHHGMLHPQIVDGGDSLQIGRVAVNILNKQLQIVDKVQFSRIQCSHITALDCS
jgi:hypothetical protein